MCVNRKWNKTGYLKLHINQVNPNQNHKEDESTLTKLCIKEITNGSHRDLIIEAINKTPKQDRKELLELVDPYIKDITDGGGRVLIIVAIFKIPKQNREKLFLLKKKISKRINNFNCKHGLLYKLLMKVISRDVDHIKSEFDECFQKLIHSDKTSIPTTFSLEKSLHETK